MVNIGTIFNLFHGVVTRSDWLAYPCSDGLFLLFMDNLDAWV